MGFFIYYVAEKTYKNNHELFDLNACNNT